MGLGIIGVGTYDSDSKTMRVKATSRDVAYNKPKSKLGKGRTIDKVYYIKTA